MKIGAIRFGLATAIVMAVIWTVCSLLVILMPGGMMQMSGHMVHSDLGQMRWVIGWGGFVYGLLAWSLIAGLTAWAITALYNWLLR